MHTNQLDVFGNEVAEIQIQYKKSAAYCPKGRIENSNDVYKLLKPYYAECMEYRERMVAVYLNPTMMVLGVMVISDGGTTGCVCDPKMIFAGAIKANAQSVIIAHNHPSGNTEPSKADIDITKRLKIVGDALNLPPIRSPDNHGKRLHIPTESGLYVRG